MCIEGFGWDISGKTPLRRPKHRWENSIKMDPPEVGWRVRD